MSRGIRRSPKEVYNDLLNSDQAGCRDCPMDLLRHHNGPVASFAYGSHDSYDVFVVAEAPGHTEDAQGEPMVGSAGDIMWSLLDYFGLENIVISNTTRCWPGKGNPDPDARAIRHCLPHVKRDILRLKPKVVLLAGKIAAQALLKSKLSLGKLRGWHRIRLSQSFAVDAYVTNHPSSIHYDPDKKSSIESDLLRIVRRLKGEDEVDVPYKFSYLTSLSALERAVDATLNLPDGKFVGHDWENTDLRLVNAHPLCLSWGWRVKKRGRAPYYRCLGVPLKHPDTPFSGEDYPGVIYQLQRLFLGIRKRHKEGSMLLGAHGAKFENAVDRDILDVALPQIVCTIQAAHAIDENRLKGGFATGKGKGGKTRRGIYSLAALSADWLSVRPEFWDKGTSDLLYSGQGTKTDVKKCTDHCARDVAVHVALWHEIEKRAKHQDFDLHRIRPLLESTPYLLGTLERNGMPVDLNNLAELRSDKGPLLDRMDQISRQLHERPAIQETISRLRGGSNVTPLFAPKGQRRGFNIRKRKYLASLFYDVLQLPWGEEREQRTKTGLAKIDKDFFTAFKDVEEVGLVAEWKQLDKLVSTYIEGWWRLAEASPDGRIRASFNAAGTTTGRLSCKSPNLMQIPRGKTEAAKILKRVFRPHCNPGDQDLRVIVACDLSQAEVRWLAEISDEPVLRDMYVKRADMLDQYAHHPSEALKRRIKQECDLHRSTASEMFGVPILDVDDNSRSAAKCFHPDTEILTRTGWKRIADLQPGEEVVQAKLDRGRDVKFEWTIPTQVFTKPNDHDHLIHLKNHAIDMRVTPDHRTPGYRKETGPPSVVPAFKARDLRYMVSSGKMAGNLAVDSRLLRLAVATQAYGVYSGAEIHFHFSNKKASDRLQKLLSPFSGWSTGPGANGAFSFRLPRQLSEQIKAHLDGKSFSWSWLSLKTSQRKIVLDEIAHWKATVQKGLGVYIFTSPDPQSLDVVQALAHLTGHSSYPGRDGVAVKKRISFKCESLSVDEEPYTGMVTCLSVPSSFVLVRDRGLPAIMGQCFHPDTEVLARSGWKRITELAQGEEVLEAYPGRHNQVVFRWTVPTEVFTQENEFDHLLHFESEGIDLTVTPDHGMVVWEGTKRNMWRRIEAADFAKQKFRSFANAGYLDSTAHRWARLTDPMLQLAVAVQADGHYCKDSPNISFGFTKERKIERLRKILAELKEANSSFVWTETEREINDKPGATFLLKSKLTSRVKAVLEPGAKSFPWSWMELSEKQRKLVLREARHWDSHKADNWKMYAYSNTDKQSVDVLQALATITARKTRLITKPKQQGHIKVQYDLSVKEHYHTRAGTVKTTKVPYTGLVACLTVDSHCVVVRGGQNSKQIPVVVTQSINFGNIYGQTAMGLAALLGVPVEEAEGLLKKWLSRFRKAGEWFEWTEKFAQKHGYVESPIGRRRHLDALLLGDSIKRGSALGHLLRVARNAPVQSVASDMNLWIAIRIQKWIDAKKKNWKLMALVHDSIISEIPIFEVLDYVKVTKTIAESKTLLKPFGIERLTVPQEMEYDVGPDYGQTTALTVSRLEQEQVVQRIWDKWRTGAHHETA